MRATVITDASHCPQSKVGGWAAWVRVDGHPDPIRRHGTFREQPRTSEHAELYAAANGLYLAQRHGATTVLLQTDCMAVVNAINRDGVVPPLTRTLWDMWDAAMVLMGWQGDLRAQHVKGHTTHEEARFYVNRWCDEHAKKAMKAERARVWMDPEERAARKRLFNQRKRARKAANRAARLAAEQGEV